MKKILPILCAVIASAISPLHGGEHLWTGNGSDNKWSNPDNWVYNPQYNYFGPPVPGETNAEIYMPADEPTQMIIDVPNVQIKKLAHAGFVMSLTSTFSSANGAKLHLHNALVSLTSMTTFDSTVEVVLTGTNQFWLDHSVTFNGRLTGSGSVGYYAQSEPEIQNVWYNGSQPNTYSGWTVIGPRVNLMLNKITGPAIPGELRVFDSAAWYGEKLTNYNGVVRLWRDHQMSDTAPVAIEGVLDLANHHETIGPLTLAVDGYITTGSGVLGLNGPVTRQAVAFPSFDVYTYASSSYIEGQVSLGVPASVNDGRVITVDTNQVLDIRASLGGAVSTKLRKTGAGELRLSGTNIFLGSTIVDQGALYVRQDGALGSTSIGTVVNGGAHLALHSGVTVGAEPLTLNGGTLRTLASICQWQGNVYLQSDSFIDSANAGGTLTLSGAISGPGGWTKLGHGRVALTGSNANTYTGSTVVSAGTVSLGKSDAGPPVNALVGPLLIGGAGNPASILYTRSNQLPASASVTILPGGSLSLNGKADALGGLAGTGVVNIGGGFLTLGENNTSSTFPGVIAGTSGQFIKTGSGTLTLTGTNTFTGLTAINQGTLNLAGSLATSQINVVSNAVLCGTGRAGPVTASAAVVSPGNSTGILVSSNLYLASGSMFRVELNGPNPGTGHDQLRVLGITSMNGATLNATLGFASGVSNQFVIVDNDGSDGVLGTFNGLPENSTLTISGTAFRLTYKGGDGNDIVLTQIGAVPQPSLSQISSQPGGSIQLNGTGIAGMEYLVQASTNLTSTNWIQIGTATAQPNGSLQFTDPDAPNFPQRFYRLLMP